MSDTQPLLTLQQLSIKLGQTTILTDICLQLLPRQIMTVIGPNGAGKTTLVRAILGFIPPSQGQIIRAKHCVIGYLPQRLSVQATLPITVQRFLQLSARVKKNTVTVTQIKQQLAQVQAIGTLAKPLYRLSGGELQRVLLARALLAKPNLLILDEPAAGVDVTGQSHFYALLVQLRDQLGCGILMISHDLHLVMAATDQVICLNGHICCSGHPQRIQADPAYQQLFGLATYTHHHDHHHPDGADDVR